ncbi:hypothetical protein C8Q75DRAFT_834914 [Abortiporus biennis]|nr:hypothetical protein C8Q75DRAFT_834914 [Abortiporus biennis]
MDEMDTKLNSLSLEGVPSEHKLFLRLKSALEGDRSSNDLKDLIRAAEANSLAEEIDPLTIVPLLLPSSVDGVKDFLDLIGTLSNAKEIMIAVQESAEKLGNLLRASTEDEDHVKDADDDKVSNPDQVVRIIELYSAAIPRLLKRKKSPTMVIQPLLEELEVLIQFVGNESNSQESRNLLVSILQLAKSITDWVADDDTEKSKLYIILQNLLRRTIESTCRSIKSNVTMKAFRKQFPRLTRPLDPDDAQPNDIIHSVIESFPLFNINRTHLISNPSVFSLILLAHMDQSSFEIPELVKFLPVFIVSIQSNTALDETLAILLSSLCPLRSSRSDVPSTFTIPIVHVLAPLASSHPDPEIRHISYRLLSTTLGLTPSHVRLRLLLDLISDSETSLPQMRIAAISLVREAVLEALSQPATSNPTNQNAFTSPLFMSELGSTIFRQYPSDLFVAEIPAEEFLDTPEPLRLVEALTLYTILVQKDVDNRTGVRDVDVLQEMDWTLLHPLNKQLRIWKEGES